MTSTVTIAPFEPADAEAFASLNLAWLVPLELFEPADEKQLYGYDESVFARGGAIFMARAGEARVGCCAAVPHDGETIEVAKLAVDPALQGQGVGRRLVEAALNFAIERGYRRAVLTSSSKLVAALKLYESVGFHHCAMPSVRPYETADVYMELDLADWSLHRRPSV
jgi:ribosomal protein S18 acetylase RimI-like enzyme